MGLDVSHGAFSGAYSAFNRLRQAVCAAAGGRHPPFDADDLVYLRETLDVENPSDSMWYVPDEITEDKWPGLYLFLEHSDCDGTFTSEECVLVATDLKRLLPLVREYGMGSGHIERGGGYGAVLEKFIDGCERAVDAGETIRFH